MKQKTTFLEVINKPIIYKFFKTLLTTERRLTGQYFLAIVVAVETPSLKTSSQSN